MAKAWEANARAPSVERDAAGRKLEAVVRPERQRSPARHSTNVLSAATQHEQQTVSDGQQHTAIHFPEHDQ